MSSPANIERSPPQAFPVVTSDRVWLSSLMYGTADAEIAVVFGHGFTGSQHNRRVVAFARRLAADGFAVYTADFRGHGTSGGMSTLGDREVNDLEALVALARGRHAKVVSVGASMGAFVALRHAGLGGRVNGVVAISSPADGREPLLLRARLLRTFVHTERGRRLLDRYGTRVDPQQEPVTKPPLDLAGDIAPVPVAIVHGGRDRYVPLSDAYALYERLGEPRLLVVLPRFGHGEAGFNAEFAVIIQSLIPKLLGIQVTETMVAVKRVKPGRKGVRIAVALVVVIVGFVVVLPKFAGISDVWARLSEMTWPVALLLAVVSVWNLLTYAWVLATATPGLSYAQAVVVTESSTAVANSVPGGGAIGVGVTAAMYRSWGFGPSATTLAVLITGVWNNFVKLGLPLLALVLVATEGGASGGRLVASALGVGVLVLACAGLILVIRSDRVARRCGAAAQRSVSWLRRRAGRAEVTGWPEAASELRASAVELLKRSWPQLTLATVVSQLSLFLVLLVAMHGVGVSSVSWVEVFAIFAFVRLLSALPLTPGGVGVVELGLTAALVAAGGGRARVVAAVLVFRAFTYIAPIVVGACTYFIWRRRSAWRTGAQTSTVKTSP